MCAPVRSGVPNRTRYRATTRKRVEKTCRYGVCKAPDGVRYRNLTSNRCSIVGRQKWTPLFEQLLGSTSLYKTNACGCGKVFATPHVAFRFSSGTNTFTKVFHFANSA